MIILVWWWYGKVRQTSGDFWLVWFNNICDSTTPPFLYELHKYFSAHLNLRESDHLLPDLDNCCLRLFSLLVSKLCFFKWDSFRPSDASLVLSASLFGNISLCSPFLCLSASGMRDYWILSGDDCICLWCWTQEVKMPAHTSFICLRQILQLGYLFVKYIEY